ncbi:ROK family transcriptional regulator [Paraliobacillus salinarum]|uniref:ROK family transcriptional regulator n=1 Tax=Paraliobacillus salinarum TaxID=1158996 RepID=UPI0015F5401A|nr:ROK family transcriptional regulator [Paraliobacillus salinarum]
MSLTKKQQQIIATILDKIYAERPISRIDIAKHTGITPATVSSVTADLIQNKHIEELGETKEQLKAGRKKILLDIPKRQYYYIGSEISQSRFTFVLTDNTGEVIYKKKMSNSTTLSTNSVEDYIDALSSFIEEIEQNVEAIGVSLPGHYNQENPDYILTNNPCWKTFDLKKLKQSFSVPIYFENNVNAMALAKRLLSDEIHSDNFIYFHVGHGMHYSYMFKKQLYSKDNFLIGEIGHTIVNPDGELCECGKYGCLQTYASETWLMKKAKLLHEKSSSTFLREFTNDANALTLDQLLDASELGDRAVTALLHQATKYLAVSLTNLNMMIDAKKVFVHGKLFKNKQLINLLREHLAAKPLLQGFEHKQEISIESYDSFNGAVGGVAVALTYHLIAFPS